MRATVASTGRTVRPRRMYFAVFVWLALPGRFLSLFLLSKGLSNTQIGIMLSLSPLVSALLGPHIAALTDAAESRRDTSVLPFLHVRGLEAGMCVCVALTAVVFCAYALFEPREGGVDTLSWEFGAMACIQVLYSIARFPILGIADALTLKRLNEMGCDRSDYGKERLWGAVGWAMGSIAYGLCLQYVSNGMEVTYGLNLVAATFVVCTLIRTDRANEPQRAMHLKRKTSEAHAFEPLPTDDDDDDVEMSTLASMDDDAEAEVAPTGATASPPGDAPTSQRRGVALILSRFFETPSSSLFVVCSTVLSMGTSIVEGLVFLYFSESLHASDVVMGLSVLVTVVFEIPIFAYATHILKSLGAPELLAIAVFAYSIRVVGYTMLPNPWMVLMFEPLHGVTFACAQTAGIEFTAQRAPGGLEATCQNVWKSIKSLFGSLVGTALGGYVQDTYGPDVLYRGAGALVMSSLVLYALVNKLEGQMGASLRGSVGGVGKDGGNPTSSGTSGKGPPSSSSPSSSSGVCYRRVLTEDFNDEGEGGGGGGGDADAGANVGVEMGVATRTRA